MKTNQFKITKKKMVENYLNTGRTITSWEAIRLFGATRLSDIIFKLKKEGKQIQRRLINNEGTHYSEYWIGN